KYNLWNVIQNIKKQIQRFFKQDSAAGLLLLFATILALIVANSPLYEWYHRMLETHIMLGISDLTIDASIHHWINDGLMAVLFLLIGLEVKRELIYGELTSFEAAILPAVAALGGAILPVLIFYSVNEGIIFIESWA